MMPGQPGGGSEIGKCQRVEVLPIGEISSSALGCDRISTPELDRRTPGAGTTRVRDTPLHQMELTVERGPSLPRADRFPLDRIP